MDSSIWLESTPTRIVWLTFIAVMDETGFAQFASIANVAHRARVTPDEAAEAILTLESPDPDSSDPDNDGRRVERVPGGWYIFNAKKHRDMVTRALIQEQTRERVRRFRDRKRSSNAKLTPSDTIAVSDTETKAVSETTLDVFEQAWANYPKRAGGNSKASALKAWNARLVQGANASEMALGVLRYAAFVRAEGSEGTRYVMQSCRFFGPDKHWDEDWAIPVAGLKSNVGGGDKIVRAMEIVDIVRNRRGPNYLDQFTEQERHAMNLIPLERIINADAKEIPFIQRDLAKTLATGARA